MSSLLQNIVIVLGLVGLSFFAYYIYTSQQGTELATEGGVTSVSVEAQVFLQQLKQIESIELDTNIMKDSDFKALQEQSGDVNPEPVGKPNPFIR